MIINSRAQPIIPSPSIRTISTDKLSLTFFSVFAFACGLPTKYVLNLMGELYATEVMLPLFALVLLISGKASSILKEPIFWKFLCVCTLMIVGYIVSDLFAGTSQANYLRAWGRNAVLLSDIVALAIMGGSDKRYLWWYVAGTVIGSVVYLKLTGVLFDNNSWKLGGYGRYTLMGALVVSYFLPYILSLWLIICVGIFSIYMDFRSLGASCLMLAGILWVRNSNPEKIAISFKNLMKIVLAGVVILSLILAVLSQTSGEYANRRGSSNVERFGAIKIGLIAVTDSPILGFGSWGEGTKKYAELYRKETENDLRELGQSNIRRSQSFMPHSQILQSWMEGGVLAATFFMFLFYQLIAGLKRTVFDRAFDYLTLLFSMILFSAAVNVIASPYAGVHRLGIALGVAIICVLKRENNYR